ncbi:hypothetical protein CR513_48197, partial [Mucuna pruriens]
MDRNIIDVASGGSLMDKTPAIVRHLISNMASNTEGANTSKIVSKVSTFDSQRLENQLMELTSLVRQLAIVQHQQVVQLVCGIYALVEHPTDMCPTLQESEMESTKCVGALRGRHI